MNDKITILIVSDIHGHLPALKKALTLQNKTDAVIFTGDGLSDLEYFAENDKSRMFLPVVGNCDFRRTFLGNNVKTVDEITLGGKKIVFTHGHKYGAKYSMDGLYELAEERNADIVLFGHTHKRHEEYRQGKYYFNPGAVCGDYTENGSAGLLTLDGDSVLFSYLDL